MCVKDIVTVTINVLVQKLRDPSFHTVPRHYTVEMLRFGGKRPAYTKCIVQHHLTTVEKHHLQPLVYTKCLAQHPVNDFPGHPALKNRLTSHLTTPNL